MKHLKLYESFFSDVEKLKTELNNKIESMRKEEEERFKDALTPIIDNYECGYELETWNSGTGGRYMAEVNIGEDCSISDLCRDLEEFNLNVKHLNPFDGKYELCFYYVGGGNKKNSFEDTIKYLSGKDSPPDYLSIYIDGIGNGDDDDGIVI